MKPALVALGCLPVLTACGEPAARLVTDGMIEGDAIPARLSEAAGDPARGARLFAAREAGHCVLCHRVAGLEAAFQGTLGPELSDVGARLSPGQMRLRIADPTRLWPDTVMPSYYRVHGLNQVGAEYRGEPILNAQEIEDVIAYLSRLEG